jgi:hypothetical protein
LRDVSLRATSWAARGPARERLRPRRARRPQRRFVGAFPAETERKPEPSGGGQVIAGIAVRESRYREGSSCFRWGASVDAARPAAARRHRGRRAGDPHGLPLGASS